MKSIKRTALMLTASLLLIGLGACTSGQGSSSGLSSSSSEEASSSEDTSSTVISRFDIVLYTNYLNYKIGDTVDLRSNVRAAYGPDGQDYIDKVEISTKLPLEDGKATTKGEYEVDYTIWDHNISLTEMAYATVTA